LKSRALRRLNVGDELRELRKLRKESTGSFVFVSERGAPFTPASFNWMIKRAGQKAGLLFQVHAHMLRHSAVGVSSTGRGRGSGGDETARDWRR
jgi:integrase